MSLSQLIVPLTPDVFIQVAHIPDLLLKSCLHTTCLWTSCLSIIHLCTSKVNLYSCSNNSCLYSNRLSIIHLCASTQVYLICPETKMSLNKLSACQLSVLSNKCHQAFQVRSDRRVHVSLEEEANHFCVGSRITRPDIRSKKTIILGGGAAIAQWIRLCLPSWQPEFEYQALHLRFYYIPIVKFVL